MKAKTIILLGTSRSDAQTYEVKAKREPGVIRQTLSANYDAAQEPVAKAGANTKEFAKQAAVVIAAGVGTLAGSAVAFAKGLWN